MAAARSSIGGKRELVILESLHQSLPILSLPLIQGSPLCRCLWQNGGKVGRGEIHVEFAIGAYPVARTNVVRAMRAKDK